MAAQGTLFGDFIQYLVDLGIADVILPFILIFTVVFAVLSRTHILGRDKKNFNVMVALVIALSVVIPHVTGSYKGVDIVDVINQALPNVSVWVILFLMALLLMGVFGFSLAESQGLMAVLAGISALIVLIIFASAAGWLTPAILKWLGLDNPKVQSLIIIIAVFAVIIWFVTSGEGGGGKTAGEKITKTMQKMFERV